MPKMKTKSSAKKRFKITASGKVLAAAAGKRHGMIKRSNKFIRDARGTMVLAEPDGKKVIKNYLLSQHRKKSALKRDGVRLEPWSSDQAVTEDPERLSNEWTGRC